VGVLGGVWGGGVLGWGGGGGGFGGVGAGGRSRPYADGTLRMAFMGWQDQRENTTRKRIARFCISLRAQLNADVPRSGARNTCPQT